MKILVTGGAGYIGGFMVRGLLNRGDEVSVLDNFSRSTEVDLDSSVKVLNGDLLDKKFLEKVFRDKFDCVIHFAGLISMGESMQNPYIYFENNTYGTLNLIEAMIKGNVGNIIFSSTAGVYGNPQETPIKEEHPKLPTNPYGESKLMVETVLKWYGEIFDLNFISLRYFNAAGASLDGKYGESHQPESHLIPNVINAILKDKEFELYGDSYNTSDGSCVRDYIHVLDLIDAHLLALDKVVSDGGMYFYNVGTGNGYSNKEVVSEIEKVSGKKVKTITSPPRPGDADVLIADVGNIKKDLNFHPRFSDLSTIVKSAWKWHSENNY